MQISDLKDKRVGIIGFGAEGRAAFELVSGQYPDQSITVFNETPLTQIPAGAVLVPGPLDGRALAKCDVLIKSPGVSLYREAIQAVARQGVQLTSGSALWFARERSFPVVAVTGSKGKSTTAALTHFLLCQCGIKAELAGNIGVPLLSLWDASPPALVVELSSYQTADFNGRPEVALLTNLFPEHLDWHGSLDRYLEDKLKIFQRQSPVCLVNGNDPESLARTIGLSNRQLFGHVDGWQVGADQVRFQGQAIAPGPDWSLPGAHNRINLAAALAAVDALGFDPKPGLDRLDQFQGLPHRLERVGKVNGITVVDDSIATAPHATLVALDAVGDSRVALIVGGYDRGVDWQVVAGRLATHPITGVIALGQNGPRIARVIAELAPQQTVFEAEDLSAAVDRGLAILGNSGCLLLSPGAPSYDDFSDYRERGMRFRKLAGC